MKKIMCLLLLTCLLLLAGCGPFTIQIRDDSGDKGPNGGDSGSGEQKEMPVSTPEEIFAWLDLDMSYEEVSARLGPGVEIGYSSALGMVESLNTAEGRQDGRFFMWPEAGSEEHYAAACFRGDKIRAKFLCYPMPYVAAKPELSYEAFGDINWDASYTTIAEMIPVPLQVICEYVDRTVHGICYSIGMYPDWAVKFEFINDRLELKQWVNLAATGQNSPLTEESYWRMSVGMTFSEVCDIAGSTGEVMKETCTRYGTHSYFIYSYGDGAMIFEYENNTLLRFYAPNSI